jgi:hypothetical protein
MGGSGKEVLLAVGNPVCVVVVAIRPEIDLQGWGVGDGTRGGSRHGDDAQKEGYSSQPH